MEKLDLREPNIWKMGEVFGPENGRIEEGKIARAAQRKSPVNEEEDNTDSEMKRNRAKKKYVSHILTDRSKSGHNFFLTEFRSKYVRDRSQFFWCSEPL